MDINIVAAILLPLMFGSLPVVLTYLGGRRKNRADAAATLTTAASTLIEDLRAEIERLQKKLARLSARMEKLEAENKMLRAQNDSLMVIITDRLNQLEAQI